MDALSSVQLDDGGNMAFVASLFGNVAAGSRALLGPDLRGGLRVLARTGDPLPGVAGATFGSFNDVAMNDRGDVVALVSFRSGQRTLDAYVVFAAEGDVWVVAEGAPYEIAPGDVRTIAGLGTLDLHNGSFVIPALELSDSRHFAFEAWFLDETGTAAERQGLFLVSVPEPGTAPLVFLGLLALSAGKPRALELERAGADR
jgi:hypothetical protein